MPSDGLLVVLARAAARCSAFIAVPACPLTVVVLIVVLSVCAAKKKAAGDGKDGSPEKKSSPARPKSAQPLQEVRVLSSIHSACPAHCRVVVIGLPGGLVALLWLRPRARCCASVAPSLAGSTRLAPSVRSRLIDACHPVLCPAPRVGVGVRAVHHAAQAARRRPRCVFALC
jgi:hypothetical protein